MLDLEESCDRESPTKPGRWKRLLKYPAILLLVLAIGPFLARWQVGRVGRQQLVREIAHLNATEPAWRLEVINTAREQAAPPDIRNSAKVVLDLHSRIPSAWTKFRSTRQWEWGPVAREQPSFVELTWLLRGQQLSQNIRDCIQTELLAPEILHCSAGYYLIKQTENPYLALLPHLQQARLLLELLEYDARVSLLNGDANRAIRSARAALVIGRSIGDEPFLISQLTRLACVRVAMQIAQQTLAWRTPQEGLKELQEELLAEAAVPWFEYGLRGERAAINKFFEGLKDGTIRFEELDSLGVQSKGVFQEAGFTLYRALLPGDQAKALEILSQYLEVAQRPSHEWTSALAQIKHPPRPPEDFRYLCTCLVLPACGKVAQACLNTKAELLAGAAAIACERFRRKTGRWPNTLGELVPTFLPAVPIDSYNGKEIQFGNAGNRVEIWSVGDSAQPRKNGFELLNPEAIDPSTGLRYGYRGCILWDQELRFSQRAPIGTDPRHAVVPENNPEKSR